MLNGIDPIILFNFKKLAPSLQASIAKIPVVADIVNAIDLPVIPLYLSERITGVMIDSESKSLEVDTSVDTVSDGSTPNVNQRGIQNTIKISMRAKADSLGLILLGALSDLVFPRVTSKEYTITYLHGATTVFGGLLHSLSIDHVENTDLASITLELVKQVGAIKSPVPVVSKLTGAVPL